MTDRNRPSFTSWDGTRISYQILGKEDARHTIVFVNGLFCTESYWVFLIRALADDWRLVTFDLRGHQFSGLPADPTHVSIDSSVRDVAALMDHLGLEGAILCGFSLGVQIIFQFHEDHPGRCQALIAITGSYENPLSSFYNLRVPDLVWEKLFTFLSDRIPRATNAVWHGLFKLPIAHGAAWLLGATRAPSDLMQAFYLHQQIVDVPTGLKMALGAVRHSARSALPRVRVPTLVIGGEKDTFTPLRLSHTMRDEIPGVQFHMVPGGTHTTLLEHPELVQRVVLGFLNRRVLDRAPG